MLVNPVNDPPYFTNYVSSLTVDEGTSSEIINFDASDIDSNTSNLSFGIIGGDSSRFIINPNTGSLTLHLCLTMKIQVMPMGITPMI